MFQGLAIEKLETKWEQYPVSHLDLNARKYETAADLVAMLNQYLEKWELLYGSEKKDRSPEERFAYIIEQACIQTGKQVVILIDEYDKPLKFAQVSVFSDLNQLNDISMKSPYAALCGITREEL